jgi:hypothetical protein
VILTIESLQLVLGTHRSSGDALKQKINTSIISETAGNVIFGMNDDEIK